MADTDDDIFAPDSDTDSIFVDEKRTYLDYVCQYRGPLQMVFSLCLAGLVLSVIVLPFYDIGDEAFTLTVMNIFGLAVVMAIIGYVLWRC